MGRSSSAQILFEKARFLVASWILILPQFWGLSLDVFFWGPFLRCYSAQLEESPSSII